jgi:Holliday junction resolvase RusA-like endonuclease
MKTIEVVIYVCPTPKGRPRITVIGGHASAYTPAKTRKAENEIAYAIRQQVMASGVFDAGVPLSLSATFFLEKPKSAPKKVTMPVKRPDLTNYLKLLEDAMNHFVYPDDSQIVTIIAKKRYAEAGTVPRIELRMSEDLD